MAVDDIAKLRPELLTKSLAELERQQVEIALAIAKKTQEAEIAAKEQLAAELNGHIEAIVSGLTALHDIGQLPERVSAALTRSDGRFVPATFFKPITAEQLAGIRARRKAAGEPRKRRRRNPVTGELE
jgi:hypothetical protein